MKTQTITLCMIAGREAAHIETVLRSFAPAYDQLSLVLALGNQEPDDTEVIARRVCAELHKIVVVSAFKNARGNDWPHVDNFAAARQQSFMQGVEMGSDWLFWADADDEASPDIGELRSYATDDCAISFGFPYDVRGSGKRPIRERLFRADAFASGDVQWNGIVHENIIGAKIMAMESPVWIHAPKEAKSQSKARNLRLLESANRDAALHSFYIHQEHHLKGDREGVQKWGDAALAMPGLPEQFRYEVYLNYVRHRVGEPMTMAAKAFALYPACREALACMALLNMEAGRIDTALVLAERLVAMPLPPADKRPWSYERKWYDWAGDDLLARLRRLNGLEAAEPPTPTISLIHATRGRVNGALGARERWLNAADNAGAIETIWCVDADDAQTVEVSKQFPHVIVPAGGGCVAAWNAGAHAARGKLFVQLSDDWIPCQGWDTKLIAEIPDLNAPAVVAVSDGHRRDDLLCMAILTRARWEAQCCELFSPEYLSVYSDNEFSVRAFDDGVVIDARPRITFEHAHPAFGRAASDKTYEESNSAERYHAGLATFNRRNPAHAQHIAA